MMMPCRCEREISGELTQPVTSTPGTAADSSSGSSSDGRAADISAPGGGGGSDGVATAVGGEGAAAIEIQVDGDVGVDGGIGRNGALDVPRLRARLAQELAAGRHVAEQIAHRDGRALGRADRHGGRDLAVLQAQQ